MDINALKGINHYLFKNMQKNFFYKYAYAF